MIQRGQVLKIKGDIAEVVVARPSACGSDCGACHASCAESKLESIEILNENGLEPGDFVELKSDSRAVLSYIGLVYGMPLLFFLLGLCLSLFILNKMQVASFKMWSLIIAAICLVLSYFLIKNIDNNFNKNKKVFEVRKL